MSIFNRNAAPATPPAETPPPADTGVSRAEFDAKFTEMMGAIRDLAQRPVVVQANQPAPIAPPPPDITDEELTEAIASGNAAGKVKELVQRKLDAARQEVGREVAAVRDHGALALGDLAERTFLNGLNGDDRATFKRYESEIKTLVNGCEPALRGMHQTWETCFATVVGAHRKELLNEQTEAALRRRADEEAAAAAPQPGRSGGRGVINDTPDVPAFADVISGHKHLQGLTEDEFLRRANKFARVTGSKPYKDFTDYMARGANIDAELDAIRNGDDTAAA